MLLCFFFFLVQGDFSLDGEASQTASACLSPAHTGISSGGAGAPSASCLLHALLELVTPYPLRVTQQRLLGRGYTGDSKHGSCGLVFQGKYTQRNPVSVPGTTAYLYATEK